MLLVVTYKKMCTSCASCTLKVLILEFVIDYRTGIKESVDWLVDVMERSKRTEMLRARASVGISGHA